MPLKEELLDLLVVRTAAEAAEPDALLAVALCFEEDLAAVWAVFLDREGDTLRSDRYLFMHSSLQKYF